MKKTLVNKINKNRNGYTVELNGLKYICDGYGFYLVADLDGADPAALRPMSTEKNSAGHILAEAVRAYQYNELTPVYNLGTVTRENGKSKALYCIMQDESKAQTAAYDLKLIGLAENSSRFEFFFFSPSGSFSPKSTFLIGVYDEIVSLVLLPVNLMDADFEALAAEATANAAAELEAKQAKKAATKEKKKALAAAMEAAKQEQEKETPPAEDPAPVVPVQEKPADDNADQAAETEPATMDPAADQTADTTPAAPVQVDAETTPHIYAYYLPHRPVSIGTQPRGFMDFEDLDRAETGYYGIVRYERELTPEEIADYELVPATDQTPADPEKTDAEKPETIPAENNADALAEAGQTETDQADPAADNGPETSETVQAEKADQAEKPAKREKKPEPREIMTKEEAAGLLTGPDWITNAAMLISFDMRNSNLIMQAALDAGLLTPQMILDYLFYYKMPAFHTFNAWKNHGYIVKRGEKAAFQADIWKYTEKHGTMTAEEADSLNAIMTDADGGELFHAGDETTESRYLMKTAYFFTAEQVEKIQRGSVDLPDDCKRETQDGREIITGNTRPIKEQIKAAGYMWDRKAACWWRPAEDPAA